MSKDIRDAAEAYIKFVESWDVRSIIDGDQFKALKAALRPSREQIADRLEEFKDYNGCCVRKVGGIKECLNYAIEELRSKE